MSESRSCAEIIALLAPKADLSIKEATELLLECSKYHEEIYKRGVDVGYKAGDDPDGTKYL